MAVDGSRYLRGMPAREHSDAEPAERPPARQPLKPPPPQHPAITREAGLITEHLAALAEDAILDAVDRLARETESPPSAVRTALLYAVRRRTHELLRVLGRTELDRHLADREEAEVSERAAASELMPLMGLGRYGVMSAFGPRWPRGAGRGKGPGSDSD